MTKLKFDFLHISRGGPILKIEINGKIVHFEMHPYCEPMLVDEAGEPIENPKLLRMLYEAVTAWVWKGRRVRDGFCVWEDWEKSKPVRFVKRNQ